MAVPRSMIAGCEQAYSGFFAKPKKAIPWAILVDLLLSLISGAASQERAGASSLLNGSAADHAGSWVLPSTSKKSVLRRHNKRSDGL